jgi:hypothetical protein
MPSESDKNVENVLRAYAEKRREAAGAPLELHPATRDLLQAEVARTYRRSTPALGAETAGWAGWWSRLAWAGGLFASLALVVVLLIQPSARHPQQLQLARNNTSFFFAPQPADPAAQPQPSTALPALATPGTAKRSLAKDEAASAASVEPRLARAGEKQKAVENLGRGLDLRTDPARLSEGDSKTQPNLRLSAPSRQPALEPAQKGAERLALAPRPAEEQPTEGFTFSITSPTAAPPAAAPLPSSAVAAPASAPALLSKTKVLTGPMLAARTEPEATTATPPAANAPTATREAYSRQAGLAAAGGGGFGGGARQFGGINVERESVRLRYGSAPSNAVPETNLGLASLGAPAPNRDAQFALNRSAPAGAAPLTVTQLTAGTTAGPTGALAYTESLSEQVQPVPASSVGPYDYGRTDRESGIPAEQPAVVRATILADQMAPGQPAASLPEEALHWRFTQAQAKVGSDKGRASSPPEASTPVILAGKTARIGSAPNAILASFEVERLGDQIRITDQDGSTYAGQVVPPAAENKTGTRMLAEQERQYPASSRALRTSASPATTIAAGAVGPQAGDFFFRAAGTNISLRQKVEIDGRLILRQPAATNLAVRARLAKATPAPGSPRPAVPSPASTDVQLQGQVVIGNTNRIEINAIQTAP